MLGFRLEWEKFPFTKEVLALQSYFKLSDEQLLAMSSTGTILAAVKPEAQEKVKAALAKIGLICMLSWGIHRKQRNGF